MLKAYWVTVYRAISDPQKLAAYAKLAPPAIAPFGGRYLARGTARLRGRAERAHRHLGIPERREGYRRLCKRRLPGGAQGARRWRGA